MPLCVSFLVIKCHKNGFLFCILLPPANPATANSFSCKKEFTVSIKLTESIAISSWAKIIVSLSWYLSKKLLYTDVRPSLFSVFMFNTSINPGRAYMSTSLWCTKLL